MKKIEVMIKRLLRISSQSFVSSFLELSILTYYCTLREFLEHSSIGERNQRKTKEGQGNQRKIKEGCIK